MKVRIYRNLNRKGMLSVQTKVDGRGWRVKGYVSSIIVKNPVFKVSEAGRQRCIASGVKNVHAFVEGDIGFPFEEWKESLPRGTFKIKYNPFHYNGFYVAEHKDCPLVSAADWIIIDGAGRMEAIGIEYT